MDEKKVVLKVKELTPWEDKSYLDLTFCMKCFFKKTFENRLSGVVFNKKMEKILAFERVQRGFKTKGYLHVSSSEFDFHFDIDIHDFTIEMNGKLLGKIDKEGVLTDASGTKIGIAKHPVKYSVTAARVRFRAGERMYPVTLNNRLLCMIRVSPD